jgi:hypothetical protein
MDRDTLENLISYLNTLITFSETETGGFHVSGCDNTLNKSALWLLAKGRDVATDLFWLESRGGHCDCEVILNVPYAGQEMQ